jgi:prevent-host-death family protein
MTCARSDAMETVSVGTAKSKFSELISRAAAGERFLIQRRDRPVAVVIGSEELERLERMSSLAHRLALALGQDPDLLAQIERGQVHPAMAAYGLWRDQEDLASLSDEIEANRREQVSRESLEL